MTSPTGEPVAAGGHMDWLRRTAGGRGLRSGSWGRGFTLLELMVVIAIVLILVGLVLGAVAAVGARKRVTLAQKQVADIVQAAIVYQQVLGGFPPDTGDVRLSAGGQSVSSAAFSADEEEPPYPGNQDPTVGPVAEPYHASGPDGYVAESLCKYLGSKVHDLNKDLWYDQSLIINPRHVRTLGGSDYFMDPWGQPYLMDAIHVLKDMALSVRRTGADQNLVDAPYVAIRVGAPYSADMLSTHPEWCTQEVKAWSLGPDKKGGAVPLSQADGTDGYDQDNIRSW